MSYEINPGPHILVPILHADALRLLSIIKEKSKSLDGTYHSQDPPWYSPKKRSTLVHTHVMN